MDPSAPNPKLAPTVRDVADAEDVTLATKDSPGSAQQESSIAAIVLKATGLQCTDPKQITGRGMSNEVWIVATSEGRLVVRSKEATYLPTYEKEAWCLEQAHRVGIPVPRVIACGVEGTRAYSIAHYIEESSIIHEGLDHLRVWKTLGSCAAKLNSIPTTGYGAQMQSPGCFKFSSWEEMLGAELAIVFRDQYWEDCGLLTQRQTAAVRASIESCADIQAPAGICHWDISPDNALIRDDNYDEIFLLDLEITVAAPAPHYQLACVAKPQGLFTEQMKAFTAGYGISEAHLAEILLDLQRLVVLASMRSVRWAQDRRPIYVQGNTEAAKATILDLMDEELR